MIFFYGDGAGAAVLEPASAAGWIAVNPSISTVLVIGVYLMHRFARGALRPGDAVGQAPELVKDRLEETEILTAVDQQGTGGVEDLLAA